ncbi:hypothetical protein CSB11_02820 [Candidatus Campbellbacteria bacterium]|nr:MAG: hypothetical protein CSB11_02820 [Candidatus Campbellbacteria bacterium]
MKFLKHNSRLNCWNKNLGPELNLGFRNYEEGDYAIYEDANSAIARKYGEGKYYVIACAKNRGADYRHGQSNVIRIEVEGDKKGNESFDFEDKKTKEKSNVKKARESLLLLKSYIRKRALETNGNLTSQDWMVIRYMFDQIHVYVGR